MKADDRRAATLRWVQAHGHATYASEAPVHIAEMFDTCYAEGQIQRHVGPDRRPATYTLTRPGEWFLAEYERRQGGLLFG